MRKCSDGQNLEKVTFYFKKSREIRVISADSLLKIQKRLCKERSTTLRKGITSNDF
jgi:hypothetical protein